MYVYIYIYIHIVHGPREERGLDDALRAHDLGPAAVPRRETGQESCTGFAVASTTYVSSIHRDNTHRVEKHLSTYLLAPIFRREYTINIFIFIVYIILFITYFTCPQTPLFSRSSGLSKYSTEIFDDVVYKRYSTTFWGLPVTRAS
jgi:hypothetical protein